MKEQTLDNPTHYKDILLVLGAAGLVVPLLMRLGVSTILGYLIVGIVLGPGILGQLAHDVPFLSAISISANNDLSPLAELGVVFLLFLIGLELSLERLLTMRRLVFGLGGLQVVVTMAIIIAAALKIGYDLNTAIILGMALSLSSTAIVIQLFADTKRLGSQAGRTSFAILLMQDLAVIPMLMLLSLMTGNPDSNLLGGVGLALAYAALAVVLIVLAGRFALRPILRSVAAARSPDLFMAAVLFIAVGTGAMANAAGLSMALGAFIAGLMLAETEYRRAIEAIIEPFKGILLGAFFLLVGLRLDLSGLIENLGSLLLITALLVTLKALINYALARIFGIAHWAAIEASVLLGPCGEFAYVILSAALAAGVLQKPENNTALLVVTLSMIAIPLLSKAMTVLKPRLARMTPAQPMEDIMLPQAAGAHVVVAGFGRVGSLVASMLEEHKIPYVAIDGDAAIVTRERSRGAPVYFGDATNPHLLEKCGLDTARALAVTMDNPSRVDEIVRLARELHPDIKIIARARDDRHAIKLYQSGATEAVPETVESSLQLAESLLVESGIPMGLAIASVHEKRDQFRKLLGRPNRKAELKSARARLKSSMR